MLASADCQFDGVLKVLTLGGTAVALIIGLMQYRRAQHWKRVEWLARGRAISGMGLSISCYLW